MKSCEFDHFARILSGLMTRRGVLVAIGAVVGTCLPQRGHALQVQGLGCGQAGAVCTQLKGCCSGLTCATSYINPAFGVCVTGEGGMLPVSDSILVPGSDGIEEELAQDVEDAAADAAAAETALAEAETERQVKIDARRTKRGTRRTTRKATNNTQQDKKVDRRVERRTDAPPLVSLELFEEIPAIPAVIPVEAEPLDDQPQDTPGVPEILRIRNHDDVDVVLSRIESIQQPDVLLARNFTIRPNGTLLLLSGQYADEARKRMSGSVVWHKQNVCPTGDNAVVDGDGVNLTVRQEDSDEVHTYSVLCNAAADYVTPGLPDPQKRQRNTEQRRKQKDRRRKAHKKRQDRKQKTRGKGR